MTTLPTESVSSIRKGTWIVFKDGRNWVRFYASNKGLERVYFNDDLVSERQKKMKLKAVHNFETPFGRDQYEVRLESVLKVGEAGSIATLTKNGEKIQQISVKQNKVFTKKVKQIVIPVMVLFVACSFIRAFYDLHFIMVFLPILLLAIMLYGLYRSKTPLVKIEDVTDFLED